MLRALVPLLCLATPAAAFELGWPIDCRLGETCHVQNYVDHDPGPTVQDFACGPLSYDGHDGTDIALPSLVAMQAGVEVRAAAAGTVKGVRDEMPDISIRDPAAPALEGKDCGNGVLIDHGEGWQTQYCHMKLGSILVAPGQAVEAGAVLGQVGLSGNTEFPHLHLAVRKDGAELDPFDTEADAVCGGGAPALWAEPVGYVAGGMIAAGFATGVPAYEAVQAGTAGETIAADAPALVFWAYYFGPRAGDQVRLEITGPEGAFFEDVFMVEKTQARAFRAGGKKLRAPLPAGPWTGTATLIRQGAALDEIGASFTLP